LKLTALFIIISAVSNLTFEGCTVTDKKASTSPLGCTLSVPQHVAPNGALTIRLTLVNESTGALDLGLQGNPPFRFSVAKKSGESVWESTYGEAIQQILELRTLAPSDSLVFTSTWNLTDNQGRHVPSGTYVVHGWVELDPPLTARADPVPLTIE
jgi:hypothetical protein